MILAFSGPPGGPQGGLLGCLGGVLGASGAVLACLGGFFLQTWRYLGSSLAILEAIFDLLGRTWKPSCPLEGHLEPSWGIFPDVEVPSGWPAGSAEAPGGVLEKNPNQNRYDLARQAPL